MAHSVIALHYWAGAGHAFDALRPLLPSGVLLLAPDLPGFGQQPVPAGFDFSIAAYADWVMKFMQQSKVQNFTLLGHSMGGKIALALAARRPPGLRRLVLLSPSPPPGEPMSDEARAASLAAYGQPVEAEKTFRKITNQPLSEKLHHLVIADNLRSTQAAWNAWLNHGSRENILADMPRIDVPCQLLVGEQDRAITPETQRVHTLPWLPAGTTLQVVPGAGHLLPLEAYSVISEQLVVNNWQ